MTATNHDDQLGEIYPMMLNELNCRLHLALVFHVFIAVSVIVCGRHGCAVDLPTPDGWKAELTQATRQWNGRESNWRPLDHKSEALTTTPPTQLHY